MLMKTAYLTTNNILQYCTTDKI